MGSTHSANDFLRAFVAELATTVGSVSGLDVHAVSGPPPVGDSWSTTLTAGGCVRGSLRLTVDRPGGEALVRAVLGPEAHPDDATVAETIREMVLQSATSLALKAPFTGATVTVSTVSRATAAGSG